jgi:ATP-binding cassette subfamily B protein
MIKQLMRLTRTHLRDYKKELWLVVLFQGLQTIATLTLPTLNADIIDNGVVKGDNPYIWKTGALMLGITFLQVVFAIIAVYYGSRAAMGFGRDVRRSLFHSVTDYSAREVASFGAPSLITRVTNDVQQVQMLVQMT